MANKIAPVIKWSGSKAPIAATLATYFPRADRYIEPFVGSGALLPYRNVKAAIAGDLCQELIALWQRIQSDPDKVVSEYAIRWKRLQSEGHTAYYEIRRQFNSTRDPFDLLFLCRTCVNGLIRFNSHGDFNNSLHHTRPGIDPKRFALIVHQWSRHIHHVKFVPGDYMKTTPSPKRTDFFFLDPPYAGTRGRYQTEKFDMGRFFEFLETLNASGARWMLTLDGSAADRTYKSGIPESLFRRRLSLGTGNSPFTKLMRQSIDAVQESVYLNFDPPEQTVCQFTEFVHEVGLGISSSNM